MLLLQFFFSKHWQVTVPAQRQTDAQGHLYKSTLPLVHTPHQPRPFLPLFSPKVRPHLHKLLYPQGTAVPATNPKHLLSFLPFGSAKFLCHSNFWSQICINLIDDCTQNCSVHEIKNKKEWEGDETPLQYPV